MLQNATPALILLLVLVALAWGLKRWRAHLPGIARQDGPALRVMSSLSLGPQMRVVTVQVEQGSERMCLVLGVSPGGIATLHTLPLPPEADRSADAALGEPGSGFAARLAQFAKAPHANR